MLLLLLVPDGINVFLISSLEDSYFAFQPSDSSIQKLLKIYRHKSRNRPWNVDKISEQSAVIVCVANVLSPQVGIVERDNRPPCVDLSLNRNWKRISLVCILWDSPHFCLFIQFWFERDSYKIVVCFKFKTSPDMKLQIFLLLAFIVLTTSAAVSPFVLNLFGFISIFGFRFF